ncbi:MAG: hypothetical protein ACLTKI_07020 [Lachnospiraceae bacterium]
MKKGGGLLIAVLAMALMSGCAAFGGGSAGFSPDADSIYVEKDQTVHSALVDTFENKEYYDQQSFQTFVEEAVSAFNTEMGTEGSETPSVKLESSQLENGTAQVIFQYASAADVLSFAKATGDDSMGLTDFAVDTVGDALVQGKVIDGAFYKPDGAAVSNETVTKQSSAVVITTEGTARIQTESKILYVTEGVTVEADNAAVTPEGRSYIIFK